VEKKNVVKQLSCYLKNVLLLPIFSNKHHETHCYLNDASVPEQPVYLTQPTGQSLHGKDFSVFQKQSEIFLI
jgi:hypothetical protein